MTLSLPQAIEYEKFSMDTRERDYREGFLFQTHNDAALWPNDDFKAAGLSLANDMAGLSDRLLEMIGIGVGLDNPRCVGSSEPLPRLHSFSRSTACLTACSFDVGCFLTRPDTRHKMRSRPY